MYKLIIWERHQRKAGTKSSRMLKNHNKQITENAKSTKNIKALPTAVWEYKKLVDVIQHEIRQTLQKKLFDRKENRTT